MTAHIVKPIDVDELLDIVSGQSRIEAGDEPREREATLSPAAVELPGVDVGAALTACGGDRQKYAAILRQFVTAHADDISTAQRLFEQGDRRRAASLVHDLCGMASMVRAMDMAHLAAAAEGAIGREDQVPELLAELKAAMDALTQSIDKIDALGAES